MTIILHNDLKGIQDQYSSRTSLSYSLILAIGQISISTYLLRVDIWFCVFFAVHLHWRGSMQCHFRLVRYVKEMDKNVASASSTY